jgi:pilus assembly protein CpaE
MADSASAIRVLIVDDIAETRENIRRLLQFEPDMEVVGMARTGREAIQLAKETQPNVILMDINMPDMDGIQATEVVVKAVPTAQIVIVSVQSDNDYLRRAMLAGARDFLSKPPPADELVNTIRRLGELSRQRVQAAARQPTVSNGAAVAAGIGGKVLSVYSPKGGAGCTTLAINLAVALQNAATRVVVVDANLQFGDVGVFFNLQGKYSIVNLAERVDELEEDFINQMVVGHSTGVKVLLAPPTPEDAELVGASQLRKIVEALREYFHYVIVDTSAVLRDVELAIFDFSDRILLVATPDIPSLANIKKYFDLIEKLQYAPEKIVLLLNRVDRRGGITAANVEETLKHTVRGQIPLDDKAVLASINSGIPLVTGSKTLPTVAGMLELAKLIRGEFEPEAAPAAESKPRKPAGLFGRR